MSNVETGVRCHVQAKGDYVKIFEGMLDEEWARKLSGQNSMSGLSDVIYRQLSQQLGVEDEIGSRKTEMELNQSSPLLQLHTDPSVILSQLPIKDR